VKSFDTKDTKDTKKNHDNCEPLRRQKYKGGNQGAPDYPFTFRLLAKR
jgi:hypothetical protein